MSTNDKFYPYIGLTRITEIAGCIYETQVYVNINSIVSLEPSIYDNDRCIVSLTNGSTIKSKESYSEVVSLIQSRYFNNN